jgi:hypothetical protein
MSAIYVGAVCDWCLGECAGCYCRGAVLAVILLISYDCACCKVRYSRGLSEAAHNALLVGPSNKQQLV